MVLKTRVFDILESKGIRFTWLAREVGCSGSMLSHYRAGRRPISRHFIDTCVRVLGLPEDVLFYYEPAVGSEREVA